MPIVSDISVNGIIDCLGEGAPGTMLSAYPLSYHSSSGNRHTYIVSIQAGAKFCPAQQAAKLNTAFPSANYRIVLGQGESIGMACYSSLGVAAGDSDGSSGVTLSYDGTTGAYFSGQALSAINFYSSNARDAALFTTAESGMTIPVRLVKMD